MGIKIEEVPSKRTHISGVAIGQMAEFVDGDVKGAIVIRIENDSDDDEQYAVIHSPIKSDKAGDLYNGSMMNDRDLVRILPPGTKLIVT